MGLAGSALAQTTINVPGDQPTIQAGINAAAAGDTVLVAPGTYTENIDFKGKAITVTSSGGPSLTTIDGNSNPGMAVVAFTSGELRTSMLSGFTVLHGGTATATSPASGGVYIHASAPSIVDDRFGANRCSSIYVNGGALIQANLITATLYQNPGTDLYCPQQGGTAVVIQGTTTVGPYTSAELLGNSIYANTEAIGAGAIEINSAEGVFLQNNIVVSNSGAYVGGIETDNVSSVTISNNLVYANLAGQGSGPGHAGGMQITAPQAIITGNTFASNNLASGTTGESATEINLDTQVSSQLLLSNNIIVGYSSTYPALNCSVNAAASSPAAPAFDHSDIFNPSGSAYGGACSSQTGTSGNISADPLFVTTGTNLHLTAGSPAIDTGNNNTVPMPSIDLEGNPRIQDATNKGYPIVDMGAYEYPGVVDGTPYGITIASSLNPAPYGQSVTFTATVTAITANSGNPSGTVTFTDGTTVLATQTLQSTGSLTGAASFTSSTLTAGTHTITATFNPAGGAQGGNASLTETISGVAASTALSSSVNPSSYGQSVTFTATVTAGSASGGTPTGTLTFLDGTSVLATDTLTASGNTSAVATYTTTSLSAGTHTITANYGGSTNLAPSSSTLTQTVTGVSNTTATISGSPNPAYLGQTVVFSVTLTSSTAGAGSPTGAVTLTVGGSTVLGTQTVTSSGASTSQASFSISTLPLGAQAIQATYNPTGNFLGSVASMTENIVQVQTQTGDFTLTPTTLAVSLQTQHHTTTALTLTSLNGFQDSVSLACGTLPAYVTCRFTPVTTALASGATASVSLYIDTDSVIGYARLHAPSRPGTPWRIPPGAGLAAIAPVLLAASRKRFRHRALAMRLLMLLAACGLLAGLTGCGSIIIPIDIPPSTPAGTYTIPITATGASTGITHTATLTLTVTP